MNTKAKLVSAWTLLENTVKESLKSALCIGLLIGLAGWATSAQAQDRHHIFPQIADGMFPNGAYYKSTFMIYPAGEFAALNCHLQLYGLSVTLDSSRPTNAFDFRFFPGGYYVAATDAKQAFHSGYATLDCDEAVFANVLYTCYAANGAKLSEATVFSSGYAYSSNLFLDYQDGSRLGIALANNTDSSHTYRLTLGALTAEFDVPPRTSVSKFADKLLVIPAGTTGILEIESTDSSYFSAIGLRFTGAVFTTIPAFKKIQPWNREVRLNLERRKRKGASG